MKISTCNVLYETAIIIFLFVCNLGFTYSQYKTERPPYEDFLNYGHKKLKPTGDLENEIIKSKVEVLGEIFKKHVHKLRNAPDQKVELVFLVDSSASVGVENFFNELKFVRKLLADFTVSYNQTRVAVVTFSSRRKVRRPIDHVTQAKPRNHKCSLLEQELPKIRYSGGGTYTLGALLEAQAVLAIARPDAVKAVFLVTDGYSNGGDPRPAAEYLKKRGVIIFTFGIQNGNVRELYDMASVPKEEHSYILDSFDEFEALARRALHEDLHSGTMIIQDHQACDSLCLQGMNCCDANARCACGTHTGVFACTCQKGFYGTGLKGDCRPCPPGTYRDTTGPGDINSCSQCPDLHMSSPLGSISPRDCFCPRGYKQQGFKCKKLTCPILKPPKNGYFVRNACDSVVNAACGMRCNTGYMLQGSSIRLCREDGTWSGYNTNCQLRSCPSLKTPKNGVMSCSSENTTVDTKCHFACKLGYQLIGSRTRTCLPVSMWDGIRAFCRPYFCKPLPLLKDGFVTPSSCTTTKVKYGTRCYFGCSVGFQNMGAVQKSCGDKGVWKNGDVISRCIDIQPPFIRCPKSRTFTTETRHNYAVVDWEKPIAKDQSGGKVHLTTVPATYPPLKLKIGVHNIVYIAKDDWGNEANCSFTITVKDIEAPTVDMCESPPTFLTRDNSVHVYWEDPIFSDNSNGFIQIYSSKEPGEFQQGETLVEYWATDESGNVAFCNITIKVQKHACDLPQDPINGVANCTENPEAVYCTLTCEDGYAFALRPQQDYFCTYDGVWQPDNNPLPFPDCSVSSISNSISQTGEMAMDDPNASVCDDVFSIGQVQNELENKLIEALDQICEEDLLCEVATVEAVCEEFLAEIEESQNSLSYTGRRKRSIQSGQKLLDWPDYPSSQWIYWNRDDPAQFHRAFRRKRDLPPLFNHDMEIKIRKKRQFGFPSGFFETPKKQEVEKRNEFMGVVTTLILQSLGKDIGMVRFSSFLSNLGSKDGSGLDAFLSAFSKEFGEEKARDVMALVDNRFGPSQAAKLVSPTETNDTSAGILDSHALNEAFMADSVADAGIYQDSLPTIAERKLFFKFNIKADVESDVKNQVDKAMKNLLQAAKDGHFDIDFGERQLRVAAIRLNEVFEYICPPGSVLQGKNCVKCPVGTFFNVVDRICQPCPSGSYQPYEGQVSCLVCPSNTSTKALQAKSEHDCKAMCLPGSFSTDTLEPCTTCPLGEYQDEYASNACSICPSGMTTWRRGSWLIDECKTKCQRGSVSESGLEPCFACPHNYFQDQEGMTKCFKCPGDSHTDQDGSKSITECFGVQADDALAAYSSLETLPINDCFSLPCKHGGNCKSMEVGFVCECTPGYTGQSCESEIDECLLDPCLNNGTCSDKFNSFECSCEDGFEGNLCEVNIDDCKSNHCTNNATCVDLVNDYKCICEAGFTGKFCETNIDDCISSSCSTSSTCVDGISDYTCLCQPGYTGRHCETDINECESSPCLHGTCTDLIGQYSCSCHPGYSGLRCELNIDDCLSSPCLNNATCTDWIEGFSCACLPGFTGKTCDSEMSTDFTLEFSSPSILDYSKFEGFPRDMDAISICFWMKTNDKENYGTPFSYATHEDDNAFTLTDYNGFVLYINGEKKITDVSTNDGNWHMICVTWESVTGNWALYKDDALRDSGRNLSKGNPIKADGIFVMGQEQDEKGGGYSAPESFVGEIFSLNIWGAVLPPESVAELFSKCSRYVGDVKAWPDFQQGVMGQVKLKRSLFCRGCDAPFIPANADVIQRSGSNPGNVVQIECKKGHKIYGDKRRVCRISGMWSGKEPECNVISCGYPDYFKNGEITGKNYVYGSKIAYSCKPGLRLIGDTKRTCQADGKWSGMTPSCEVIQCSSPEPMNHAKVVSNLNPYLPTNKVAFACNAGYQMDGPAFQNCGQDGEWEGDTASCQPLNCDTLPSIKNGYLDVVGGAKPGFPLRVLCNPGFKLKGAEGLACDKEGKWPDELPKCVSENCEKPPDVENGVVKIRASTTGKEAYYKCDPGYVLDGSKNLLCTSDGEWDSTYPKCVPLQCPEPETLQNGNVKPVDQWTVGTKAVYECNPGYVLSSNSERSCVEGYDEGEWEGDIPTCDVIECPSLNDIAGGNYFVKHLAEKPGTSSLNFYSVGDEVELLRAKRSSEFAQISFPQDYEGFGQSAGQTIDYGQSSDPGQTDYGFDNFGQSASDNGQAVNFANPFDTGQSTDYGNYGQSPFGEDLGQSTGGFDYGQSIDYFDFGQSQTNTIDSLEITPFYYNTTAEYDCKPGYKLIGSRIRRCSETGDWDVPEPRCYEQYCPALTPLENGYMIYHGSGPNSKVEFICNDGYNLVGENEIHCQSDRTWLGAQPTCELINCGIPPTPDNGTIAFTSTTYGAMAVYDCFYGFVLEGSFERFCGANKFWNGSMPRCVSIICKVPPVIDNGYITFEGSLYAGSPIEYECKECFKLNGTHIRNCQLDGTWNLQEPTCNLIFCDPLPSKLENGKRLGSDHSCGSLVEYECHPGYKLKGRRKATCLDNAKWSSKTPRCEKVECQPPPRIANGKMIGDSYKFMDNVTYECNIGHKPKGDTQLVCNESSKWSGSPPTCNIIYCKKPKGPSNGKVRLSGLFYNSYALIVCDPGFKLDGDRKLTCKEDGKWDKIMPYCLPIICEIAAEFPHSYYNSTEKYFEAFTTLNYRCNDGYFSVGVSDQLKCNATGFWEGDGIDCQPVDCGEPPKLDKRTVTGNIFTFENTISFTCEEGYKLLGSNTSVCLASGQWSHNASCQIIRCSPLSDPEHGHMHTDDILSQYNARVHFTCDVGYNMIGKSNITCEEDGAWTDDSPICKPVSCPNPEENINGKIIGDIYEFEHVISYSCNDGFYLVGDGHLECQANGLWSALFPICEMIVCAEPEDIQHGTWTTTTASNITEPSKYTKKKTSKKHSKGHTKNKEIAKLTSILNHEIAEFQYRSGHKIQYTCDNGHFKTTDGVMECKRDGWSAHPPQCHPITCPLPIQIRNGKVIGTEVTYGSVLQYECNDGHDLFGSRKRTCQASKSWTDTEPYCRPVECPPPAHLVNGQTIGTDFKYPATLNYVCDAGFRLVGDASRTCQSTGYWTGQQPECIEIFCDAPEQISNALIDITNLKVGGVARYQCMEGFDMEGKETLNCLNNGSWDNVAPKCVQIDCGPPSTNKNLLRKVSSTVYASKVGYVCQRGYRLVGQDWASCLSTGKWSNGPPSCEEIFCPPPVTPVNVVLIENKDFEIPDEFSFEELLSSLKKDVNSWKKGEKKSKRKSTKKSKKKPPHPERLQKAYKVDDEIHYACKEGWIPTRGVNRTCTQQGTWSGVAPACKRVFCGPPVVSPRAKFSGEDFSYGGIVSFACAEGYYLKGSDAIECGINAKWNATSPKCHPEDCGHPAVPANGHVKFTPAEHGLNNHYGSKVVVSCNTGYELIGSSTMTCTADGTWMTSSGKPPKCKEMRCPAPPGFPRGTVVEVPGSIPQRAVYSCNTGYNIIGKYEAVCELGKWVGLSAYCDPVNCYEPPIPPNGKITAKHFTFGAVANYSCVVGFSLRGNPSIQCGADGNWTGNIPECRRIDCGPPKFVDNGVSSFTTTSYGSAVTYKCNEGYELKGTNERLCSGDGKWSGELPQCYRINCGDVSPPKNGFVIGSKYLYEDVVKFTCKKGFVLTGKESATCLSSGNWSLPLPTCEPVKCGPPPFLQNMDSGIDTIVSDFVFGDTITYSCQKGHIARGDLSSKCLPDGSWSTVKGECSRTACGRPVVEQEGAILLGRSYYYKDRVRVSCPPGTKPNGTSTMTCLDTGSWSGEVTCIKGCRTKCLNGGVCLSKDICSCPSGYSGKRCEKALCALPCLNGGTCVGPYKCSCSSGYAGHRCQTPLCPKSCLNGGVCIGPQNCLCLPGYAGERCQTPVCEQGCGRTGRCIGPNVCLCAFGRTGKTCEDDSDDYYDEEGATFYDDWDIAALRRRLRNPDEMNRRW